MNDFLQEYRIRIRTLGPVHIGAGSEIKKTEWIEDYGKEEIIVTDPKKLMEQAKKKNCLNSFVQMMSSGGGNLYRWKREENLPIDMFRNAAAYTLSSDGIEKEDMKKNNIAAFVKDPYGAPYIPGSSLKGAVRNILRAYRLSRVGYPEVEALKNAITKYEKKNNYLRREAGCVDARTFRTQQRETPWADDPVNDELRGIRISDSLPLNLSSLTLCQKVDVSTDGSESRLPLLRECLRPGTEIEFALVIDRTETQITVQNIFKAVDEFYSDYRTQFLGVFQYREASDDFRLPEGHILFLGGGVGYPSKTVLNQALRTEADQTRVNCVSKVLEATSPKRKGNVRRAARPPIVSPRVVKLTEYDGEYMQMGACEMVIEEK